MSQPRARRSGSSESRCASEPEMPATFWTCRTPHPRDAATHPVGPVLDRVARFDRLAQLAAERVAVDAARARASFAARSSASSRSKRSSGGSSVGEAAVRGEHRHARRRRLVDHLVRGALTHVVDEHVLAREQAGDLGAVPAPSTRSAGRGAPRRSSALARSSSVSDGPRSSETPSAERGRAHDRLEPLRRRVAAERERAQASPPPARARRRGSARRRSRGRSRRPSGASGNESAVDGEHRGRHRARRAGAAGTRFQCVNQSSSGTRGAARAAPRAPRERRHVHEHRGRPRRPAPRASAAAKRQPAPAREPEP